jgi:hypothetical protein
MVASSPTPLLSHRDAMTPTPPSHPSFHDGLRYAGRRRPPNRNPYDTSHHTPPNPQTPVTPLPDNGVEIEELSNDDAEDEDDVEDIDVEEEIEGEENDVDADEEEGGVEEGAPLILDDLHSYHKHFPPYLYHYEALHEALSTQCLRRAFCKLCGFQLVKDELLHRHYFLPHPVLQLHPP